MASDNIVEIELVIDDDKLQGQLKGVDKDAKKSGQKAGDSFGSGFSKAAIAGVAAVGAAFATFFSGREIIAAASRQQDAINKVNSALIQSGDFSQKASKDLQDFASSIQNVTRFGDEAVLEQIAFAKSLGATTAQAKDAVKAAADLSAATGMDFNSAVRNVTKTLGGYAGELGEVIPALKDLTKEQLQNGEGVRLLAAQYKGFAERDAKTFSGAVDQLKNRFGDLLESIGLGITTSPKLAAAISFISNAFLKFTNSIDVNAVSSFFDTFVTGAVDVAANVIPVLIRSFNVLSNGFSRVIGVIKTAFGGLGTAALFVVQKIAQGFEILGVGPKGFAESVAEAKDSLASFTSDSFNETVEDFKKIPDVLFNPSEFENKSAELLEKMRTTVAESNEIAATVKPIDPLTPRNEDGEPLPEDESATKIEEKKAQMESLTNSIKKAGDQAAVSQQKMVTMAQSVGTAFKKGFGQGVAGGFAAFGKALVTGENAIAAFGKAFLAQIGQIAVQQGALFILQGLGFQVIPGLQASGSALVAAGIGLSVLGGALSGLAGGGQGGGVAAGGGGTFSGTGTESVSGEPQIAEQDPNTGVTVNIQGDVLDSEDTGLRIVDLISDSFDKDDVRVTGGLA